MLGILSSEWLNWVLVVICILSMRGIFKASSKEKIFAMVTLTIVTIITLYSTRAIGYTISEDNVKRPSNVSTKQINEFLEGTELEGLGAFYTRAEFETGVNAVFLMCLSILESGWGESRLAQEKNNITGFSAYNTSPFDSADVFRSKGDCILYTAWYLKENYLSEDGKHFNGLSIEDINSKYCLDNEGNTDTTWTEKIVGISLGFITNL